MGVKKRAAYVEAEASYICILGAHKQICLQGQSMNLNKKSSLLEFPMQRARKPNYDLLYIRANLSTARNCSQYP